MFAPMESKQRMGLSSVTGMNSMESAYNEPYVAPGWLNSTYGGVDPYGDVYGLGIDIPWATNPDLLPDSEPEPQQRGFIAESLKGLPAWPVLLAGIIIITVVLKKI